MTHAGEKTDEQNATLNDYEIVRPIRISSRWVAYLAKDKTGNLFTLTYIDKQKIVEHYSILAFQEGTPSEELDNKALQQFHEYQDSIIAMVNNVKELRCDHVAGVHRFSFDREKDQLVIVSDYAPGVDIFEACRLLNPKQVLFLFTQVLEGLKEIHDNGLLHLNIKPSRICVDFLHGTTPSIKLTDFGFGIPISGYKGRHTGTLFYMAPEVVLDQHEQINESSDLFSFAVTMYYCLTGTQPLSTRFVAQSSKKRLMKLIECEDSASTPPSHYKKEVSPEMDELILGLLQKRPQDRICKNAADTLNTIYEKWPEESRQMMREGTSTLMSYES